MENTGKLFKSPGNQGYILFPRRLMEMCFSFRRERVMNVYEAYVYLLLKVCYKDQEGEDGLKRGEIGFSMRRLAEELGWSLSRLLRFLRLLEEEGVIVVRRRRGESVMTLLCYEEMCYYGKVKLPVRPKLLPEEILHSEELFEGFWMEYNTLTGYGFVDREETKRVWDMLSMEDREMAYARINDYVCSLPDLSRARTPLNYLLKRSFVIQPYCRTGRGLMRGF